MIAVRLAVLTCREPVGCVTGPHACVGGKMELLPKNPSLQLQPGARCPWLQPVCWSHQALPSRAGVQGQAARSDRARHT